MLTAICAVLVALCCFLACLMLYYRSFGRVYHLPNATQEIGEAAEGHLYVCVRRKGQSQWLRFTRRQYDDAVVAPKNMPDVWRALR